MKKMYLLAVLFCLCFTSAVAQHFTIAEINTDSTFNKTIDFLQENKYFIQSLDKEAGFIQAKIYIKHNKVLSAKDGERRTLNFVIRPTKNNHSKISLSIYCEENFFGGENLNRVYYYVDKGVSEDESLYKEVLDKLQKALK